MPFDCLEFDDAMATVDVLYDLAFLLMDLWHRGLKPGANLVLNRYLDVLDESDGLTLVPLLMAIRAAVRAHVSATRAEEPAEAANAKTLRREAVSYFHLAQALLKPVPPRLVAIGGFSGSGKSTVAAAIAEAIGAPPGARVLSTATASASAWAASRRRRGCRRRPIAGKCPGRSTTRWGKRPSTCWRSATASSSMRPSGGPRTAPGSSRWRPPSRCRSPASGWSWLRRS